ncbi:MAG: DUF4249 family protein [Calditrichaceae bacterium]|nr:DUF4249 family protein [Calditrichaceae bacterium]MBN2710281.1 DUF4249 family protein [Calditrichaceae bacterium]
MNITKSILMLITAAWIMSSCGEASVDVKNESYEPRIVIEGFLIAGQRNVKMLFTKNFRVDEGFTNLDIFLDLETTEASVTCLDDGKVYELSFIVVQERDEVKEAYWGYQGSDFLVEPGKTYQLNVSAVVEGQNLSASSITKVPPAGFKITHFNHDSLVYWQKDENGNVLNFEITFDLSADTDFYMAAIQALNPTLKTFIYDNPYGDVEEEDIDLDDDAYKNAAAFNLDPSIGYGKLKLEWYDFSFYDDYRIVMFATDQNYREFLVSFSNVMEIDGNFHEAKFNIEGQGIGIFGSMIADTVYCKVLDK